MHVYSCIDPYFRLDGLPPILSNELFGKTLTIIRLIRLLQYGVHSSMFYVCPENDRTNRNEYKNFDVLLAKITKKFEALKNGDIMVIL